MLDGDWHSGWKQYIKSSPTKGFDALPFFDVLLISCFIAINFSQFILTPGVQVELPRSMEFTESKVAPSAVLTIDRNELYFFQGKMLTADSLAEGLIRYTQELPDTSRAGTLLIKAHRQLSTEVLLHSMDKAREAGFSSIHIAAESSAIESTLFE